MRASKESFDKYEVIFNIVMECGIHNFIFHNDTHNRPCTLLVPRGYTLILVDTLLQAAYAIFKNK